MAHVVLIGDSIFDNAAYVAGGPDVLHQLRERLPSGWRASRVAVDGSLTADVKDQLARVPRDATHLVVSAGGNDALQHVGILEEPARSIAEALDRLAEMRGTFQTDYTRMLDSVVHLGRPTVLCTIYDPCFPDRRIQRLAAAALAVFNDVITRLAGSAGAPLIDLRRVFDEAAYYANPIEPSVAGGAKLADAVCRVLARHDFATRLTVLYP